MDVDSNSLGSFNQFEQFKDFRSCVEFHVHFMWFVHSNSASLGVLIFEISSGLYFMALVIVGFS